MTDEKTNDEPVVDDETVDAAPETSKPTDPRTDDEIIAAKSADIDSAEASDGEHVKIFVLPPGPKPTTANGFDHSANEAATRRYAISQGLCPTGDVRHVSTEPHRGGPSWALTYAVPVVPAERFDHVPEADIVTGGEETHITGQTPDKAAE